MKFSMRYPADLSYWPAASASEATALRRYTNLIIIIKLCMLMSLLTFIATDNCSKLLVSYEKANADDW